MKIVINIISAIKKLSIATPLVIIFVVSCLATNEPISHSADKDVTLTISIAAHDTAKEHVESSQWWPDTVKDWVLLIGGIVGFLGGLTGMWSAYRPSKIVASYLDHIGIVVSHIAKDKSKIHLPLVFVNLAKKPGVVTSLKLHMCIVDTKQTHIYKCGLFWKEQSPKGRFPERTSAPIPVPGFACVERNVEFQAEEHIEWRPQVYEFKLLVTKGRKRISKSVSKFYAKPTEKDCSILNSTQSAPQIYNIPIFSRQTEVNRKDVS
ncbi:MAG: hypothetical protein LWX54_14590 [Deltaproteobacteria bacterium]|jgi:hypothetical protein|nr:hypothetical protein [Deltaproteobacteria bacterium]